MPNSKRKSATKRGGKTPQTGARRSQRQADRNNIDKADKAGEASPAIETSPVAVDDIGRANRDRRASRASPKG